ncbi:MAG: endonuclease/exonuclease/phosphatase family protein [Candidatus Krumholzibacteria bacterium]|nr:endonuclease/exonuclease/phosphatase family protein [Candidatus Krumholzibacteria bacterium]
MSMALAGIFSALICASLVLSSCGSVQNYLDPAGPAYAGGSVPADRTAPDSIRVVTYNVKFARKVPLAIEELRRAPGISGADIILLQEMDSEGVGAVAESLGLEYLYFPASVHRSNGKDFGNAILSRWPIGEPRKIVLPHASPLSDQRRIAAAATVDAGGLRIRVVSIHTETLWMSSGKRIEQADSMLQVLSREYAHVIVGGDFNTPFRSSIEDLEKVFTRRGFRRASDGADWTAKILPFGLFNVELDHIFTKGFEPVRSGTWKEAEASDHVPLWALVRPGR